MASTVLSPKTRAPGVRGGALLSRLIPGAFALAMMAAPAACGGGASVESGLVCDDAVGETEIACKGGLTCAEALGKTEVVYVCAPAGGAACPASGTESARDLVRTAVYDAVPECDDPDPDCWCDTNVEKVLCGPDPEAKSGECCYIVEYSEDAWCA